MIPIVGKYYRGKLSGSIYKCTEVNKYKIRGIIIEVGRSAKRHKLGEYHSADIGYIEEVEFNEEIKVEFSMEVF